MIGANVTEMIAELVLAETGAQVMRLLKRFIHIQP